jgi:flagellin-like hook-associated protein FlgL
MIPRTTTVGSLKTYRYNMNRSSYTMNTAMNKVITQRNFNSFAEDPAIASRCFQLRRSYLRANTQLNLTNSVYSKYQQAWSSLDSVSSDIARLQDDTAFGSILRAENGPTASGRNALGQSMIAKADSIIQTMNGRFGENFVFAGADTLNVPFTWHPKQNPDYIDPAELDPTNPDHANAFQYYAFADPANPDPDNLVPTNDITDLSKVIQDPVLNPARGEDYDTTLKPGDEGYEAQYLDADGNPTDDVQQAKWEPRKNPDYNENTGFKYLKNDGTGTNEKTEAARALYYRGEPVDENDNEKMEYYLKEEKRYMDLGLGHQEKDGKVVPSSVFDSALQGIFYLGDTGTTTRTAKMYDENGNVTSTKEVEVPNNIVSIINRMGQILLRCDPDNGAYASEDDEYEARALAQQFEDVMSTCSQRYVELDAQSGFLRDNAELLTQNMDTLQEQFLGMEDVDPAAAISDLMYARYCYDTALKVGNSILSQSLMDYMSL